MENLTAYVEAISYKIVRIGDIIGKFLRLSSGESYKMLKKTEFIGKKWRGLRAGLL